jgi:hypothetical protein
MTRNFIAIAVVGTVFSISSNVSQAAPIAPLSGATAAETVTQVSWHGSYDRGSGRHGHHRGGGFAKFGGLRSIMAMMGGSGGMASMMSMMGSMGGGGGGGFESMLGSGGVSSLASMMGGSGGMSSMMGMMGGSGGGGFSGGGSSGGAGHVSESARQACTPDALRLCSDAIPDVGKVKACMQAKSTQLSEPCRAAMGGGGGTPSGDRAVASSEAGPRSANYGGEQRFTSFRGDQNFGNNDYGNYGGGGQGYDQSGTVRSFGGGMDIGRMIGMARSMGLGSSGFGSRDW